MKLAIDNDFFCKTALLGLADRILSTFETSAADCVLLPSLAPQLRSRKRSSKVFRAYESDAEVLLTETARFGEMDARAVDSQWLDKLTSVDGIDPGEAQLLAYVASTNAVLLATHDKVCLRAIPEVEGLVDAMAGRVVIVETALLHLCETQGFAEVHEHVQQHLARTKDTAIRSCFGGRVESVRDGLNSYIDAIQRETSPKIFWTP